LPDDSDLTSSDTGRIVNREMIVLTGERIAIAGTVWIELLGLRLTTELYAREVTDRLYNWIEPSDRGRYGHFISNGNGSALFQLIKVEGAKDRRELILTVVGTGVERVVIGLVNVVQTQDEPDQDTPSDIVTTLNAVFDGIEDAIFLLDEETMAVHRTNLAAARMFETSAGALIGQSPFDLIAEPERRNEVLGNIRSKLKALGTLHFDMMMRRGSGDLFPALHGVTVIKDKNLRRIGLMWIVSDMSHRVSLNRAVIELETRYRLLFERSGDPTFIIDAGTLKVIDANNAAAGQLGYSRRELIGLPIQQLTPEERWDAMYDDLKRIGDGIGVLDGINLTRDGRKVPVQVTVSSAELNGRNVLLAASRNVSDQRQLEEQRVRAQKLDAVRQITGGPPHELSQPLQALVTIAELITRPELIESELRLLASRINPAVERMVSLIEQMKRIVKLETKPYAGKDDILDIEHSSR